MKKGEFEKYRIKKVFNNEEMIFLIKNLLHLNDSQRLKFETETSCITFYSNANCTKVKKEIYEHLKSEII